MPFQGPLWVLTSSPYDFKSDYNRSGKQISKNFTKWDLFPHLIMLFIFIWYWNQWYKTLTQDFIKSKTKQTYFGIGPSVKSISKMQDWTPNKKQVCKCVFGNIYHKKEMLCNVFAKNCKVPSFYFIFFPAEQNLAQISGLPFLKYMGSWKTCWIEVQHCIGPETVSIENFGIESLSLTQTLIMRRKIFMKHTIRFFSIRFSTTIRFYYFEIILISNSKFQMRWISNAWAMAMI